MKNGIEMDRRESVMLLCLNAVSIKGPIRLVIMQTFSFFPLFHPFDTTGFFLILNAKYGKPINLKFKANPEILILHVVNIIPTNFQSKILSPGLLPAI